MISSLSPWHKEIKLPHQNTNWNSLHIRKILYWRDSSYLKDDDHLLIILYEMVTFNAKKFLITSWFLRKKFLISWFFGPEKCLTDWKDFWKTYANIVNNGWHPYFIKLMDSAFWKVELSNNLRYHENIWGQWKMWYSAM